MKTIQNLLPKDGTAEFLGDIFSSPEADKYFDILFKEIEWKNDEANMFGKKIITKRKVAWYADKEFSYTYSKVTKIALPWTKTLLELKSIVESISKTKFNSCLLNLYHDGQEGMAWHSDDEKALEKKGCIASLSFGAERKFGFKHKQSGEKVYIQLTNGSLLLMKGETQSNWLHRLPTSTKITQPRINLTFRTMLTN